MAIQFHIPSKDHTSTNTRTIFRVFNCVLTFLTTFFLIWSIGIIYAVMTGALLADSMAIVFVFSIPFGILSGIGALAILSIVGYLVVDRIYYRPRWLLTITREDDIEKGTFAKGTLNGRQQSSIVAYRKG
ncbi:MAG: hypothetical protein Q9219_001611 [cf. Caloplaca sp. 3 TL-2023]